MIKVNKFIVNDGTCFDTEKEAKKHIEVEYGKRLTSLVNSLLTYTKYMDTCEFIDINLDSFEELIELRKELDTGIQYEE